MSHALERVLPTGRMQILFNLAADTLIDCCPQTGKEIGKLSPSILAGPRSSYEIIDCRDLQELIGVTFRVNGAAPLFRQNAKALFEQHIPLAGVWTGENPRDHLRELTDPLKKLRAVELWLLSVLRKSIGQPNTIVAEGLKLLGQHSVHRVASTLGMSERRLHQLFSAEVGMSPKLWARTARFQRATGLLHAGKVLGLEQLALECGYFDQSHFCRDFKEFSGLDPSTYAVGAGPWRNHVPQR